MLRLPVQLGEHDDRNLEFLGQSLDARGDFGNFDLPVVLSATRGRAAELEIIDGDQLDAVAIAHAPCLGPQLEDGQTRGIIDEDLALAERGSRVVQLAVLGTGQHAGADFLHVDAGPRAEHTLHELLGAHFETEDTDRFGFLEIERDVFDDVHGQGGFTHGGPRGHDDHFARMQAIGHLVEDGEAGGQTADAAPLLIHFFDVFQGGEHLVSHVRCALAEACFADGENLALDVIEQLRNIALFLVATRSRGGAGGDHAAEKRLLDHDFEVMRRVGRGGNITVEFGDGTGSAHRVEKIEVAQAVGQRDDIDLLVGGPHFDQDAINGAVRGRIERLFRNLLGAIVEHLAGSKEDRAEERFLCFDILGQSPVEVRRRGGFRRTLAIAARRSRGAACGCTGEVNGRNHAKPYCETAS